jgi:hypothetical protein
VIVATVDSALTFQTVARGVGSGPFSGTLNLSQFTFKQSSATMSVWAVADTGAVSAEVSLPLSVIRPPTRTRTKVPPPYGLPTPSLSPAPTPSLALALVQADWDAFDLIARRGDDISFTLNGHGYSIVCSVDGESYEVANSVSLPTVAFSWGFSQGDERQVELVLEAVVSAPTLVNVSIAAVVRVPGQETALARIDADRNRLSLTGAGRTLEWSLGAWNGDTADACWVGDAATIDSSRWTHGTELVHNGTDTGMAISWLNRRLEPPYQYLYVTVELLEDNAEPITRPPPTATKSPSLVEGFTPSFPEPLVEEVTSSFTEPLVEGFTSSFTEPLVRFHFRVRRILRILYPLVILD